MKSFSGFLGTIIAIVLLSMGYEFTRGWISVWKLKNSASRTVNASARSVKTFDIILSSLYAFQVGYSFMLMLVFMTYNGWYMLAVVLGAGIGNYLWGNRSENLSMSCH